jgi:hypothetical protein
MIAGRDLARCSFFQACGLLSRARYAPPCRPLGEFVLLAHSRPLPFGIWGKPPLTPCPHRFSTGTAMRPVHFFVDNFGGVASQKLADFFSCTPGGLCLRRSMPVAHGVPPDCPQRNPPAAHNLDTGSQHVIHKLVLALAPPHARMSEPRCRTVWTSGRGVTRGEGGVR